MNEKVKRGIAFTIVGVLLFCVMSVFIGLLVACFGKTENVFDNVQTGGVYDGDGNELKSGTVYNMVKAMAFTSSTAEAYAAADGITLSATLKDSYGNSANEATNAAVSWSVAFKNANSEWASGKTVSDYVTVTPEGGSVIMSQRATVVCKGAFGEQIIITASAVANPTVKATCTVDYLQRITDFSVSFGNDIHCNFGGDTEVSVELMQSGTPNGGNPHVDYGVGIGTVLANSPRVTYTLSAERNFLFRYFPSSSTSSYLRFSNLSDYDVNHYGLRFGIRWFVTNLGLEFVTSQRGQDTVSGVYDSLTISEMQERYNDCLSNANYASRENLEMFVLTVSVSTGLETFTRSTTFVMGAYTTVATFNSLELTNTALSFPN